MLPKGQLGLKFTQRFVFRYMLICTYWLNMTKILKIHAPKGSIVFFFTTAGLNVKSEPTTINLPANQKGYNNFETTAGKLSTRRIQICRVYFSKIIFDILFKKQVKILPQQK